jgi:hypothetical protein
MPKRDFALEPGGLKRLEIEWKAFWKNITIRLDGSPVGTIANQKELASGREFDLPDGSKIKVQLVSGLYGAELRVLRNGQPLPGSDSDPATRLKNAYVIIYFIAGLNLVLGLLAGFLQVEFLQSIGMGWISVLYGLIFLVLGWFVQRRSMLALILSIGLYTLDGLVYLYLIFNGGGSPALTSIFMRVILLIPMIQGIGALQSIKKASDQAVISQV